MKIVYLHQYFRTSGMAGGTRSYEFARRLVDRGHEVHVITSDTEAGGRGTAAWRTSVEAGATVHWAAVPYQNSMSYRRRIQAFGHFAWLAAHRAAALEQDVVFATSTPLTIALPAVYSARRRRAPMVFEVRDLWPEVPIALGALRSPLTKRAAWMLEGWAYQHSKHVIALSPRMADSIRRRFPATPVTVVPNGCDIDLFADADEAGRAVRAATPWLANRPLMLYAGALGLVNGVDYIVHMAAALRHTHPDVRIAVMGSGAQKDHVRRLAHDLGVLDQNLFMLDQVPKSEVTGLFGACDLALSTVVNEPTLQADAANKVFDALAAGRPVAVNHEGWLADLLRSTGAGVLLPPDDPREAASRAGELVCDPQACATARAAAARLAREHFARDTLFNRLEEVLLDVVRDRRRTTTAASDSS
jgi:glycosyltransferase involved in cell wall biosynthesis